MLDLGSKWEFYKAAITDSKPKSNQGYSTLFNTMLSEL